MRRAPVGSPGTQTTIASSLPNPTYLALDPAAGNLYVSCGGAGSQQIRRMPAGGGMMTTLPCPLTTYGGLAFSSSGTVSLPESGLPAEFALERLSANPSSGPVRVSFALPRDARVRLSVFDLQGREVAVLADGDVPAGRHERTWSAQGARETAPAGVYFLRMSAEGRSWVERIVRLP